MKYKYEVIGSSKCSFIDIGRLQGTAEQFCRVQCASSTPECRVLPAFHLKNVRLARVTMTPQSRMSLEITDASVDDVAALHAACDTILARVFKSRHSLFRKDNVPRDLQVLHHYLRRPVLFDTKSGLHRIVIEDARVNDNLDVKHQKCDVIIVLQAILFNPNNIALQWKVTSIRSAKTCVKKSPVPGNDLPDEEDLIQKYEKTIADIAHARQLLTEATSALDAVDNKGESKDINRLHAALLAMEICRAHATSIVRMC